MALLCIDNLLQMCALILFLFLFFLGGRGGVKYAWFDSVNPE